ncbi:MAG: tRNA pseudouridine synthase A [Flavobacteriaceae bacterium]|nr:tRNA pseudouridine synthase A [Flavobacteriaceae bacterium]
MKKNPFTTKTTLQIPYQKIDVSLMNEAATELLKHHNFKCFSRTGTDVKTFDCAISEAYWKQKDEMLVFTVTADRFLRNMVRAMVGTLLEIGMNKRAAGDLKRIIESQSRENAGASVKAHGLFLTKITYPYKLQIITE